MKSYYYSLFILFLGATAALNAQPYATWTKTELKLNNGIVERTIKLPAGKGPFITTLYKPVAGGFKYLTAGNTDFQFETGNTIYSGKSNWTFKNIEKFTDTKTG